MALSPAQRHTARIEAERRLKAGQSAGADASLHTLIVALNRDVATAAGMERAERTRFKRDELLPRWLPTVEQYLSGDAVFQNPVFAWCVVWLFDTEQFDQALDWADRAIEQGQDTPEPFRSRFPVFVADTVLAWAEREACQGQPVEPYFSRTLENVMQRWTVPEALCAKYLKFQGLQLLRDENGEPRAAATEDRETLLQAREWLEKAQGRDHKCGVGTMLGRIAQRLRALDKTTASQAGAVEGSADA
ncbi:terminase [Jejubacter calystegiae]|uniref:Terminase n=1 Tax=Jejubacter calystegiae TaxID=2579935 RepID=A0A4P8YDD3_9ENTR|nr:phage terminase small subunit [Jejubacter calystegiae]QCT18491.1 terminase [Jejubacter calystegiae]